MRTRAIGPRLSRFSAAAVALVVALSTTSTVAQPAGGRERRLDGSSAGKFETSVALLQNELSERRREDFDVALAMIWINQTASSGDLDGDRDFDIDDMRLLEAEATDLLTEIQRGNLVSAVEEREQDGGDYTAADYFAQLDGLGYDEVLSLAGRPSEGTYLEAVRNAVEDDACRSRGTAVGSRMPRRSFDRCSRVIDVETAKTHVAAIEALNEREFEEARAAITTLDFAQLNPYELSTTERVLSAISSTEGNPAATREHLLNALAARGLNAEETRGVLEQIRFIDSLPTVNTE